MKIAFFGVAGSGKDFLAFALSKQRKFHMLSFGKYLKEICAEIFPEVYPYVEDSDKIIPKYGKSHREIWIEVASSLRKIDNEIFVKKVEQKIKRVEEKEKEEKPNIIITDLRDEVEYNMLSNHGFIFIHVIPRDGAVKPKNEYDDRIQVLKMKEHQVFINSFEGRKTIDDFIRFLDRL